MLLAEIRSASDEITVFNFIEALQISMFYVLSNILELTSHNYP